MKKQNYHNHKRIIFLYHILTFTIVLAIVIGSGINLVKSIDNSGLYSASLIFAMSLVLISFFFFSRIFALRAQDRAIRAEENFRHYILTGKALPLGLKINQIIGLRFSSDEEFPGLTEKALKENLSNDEIKRQIKNWRADNHRA